MDFIISINKPQGMTSQEAVTAVKKALRVKKAGHTGTLDPIATGLLIVCVNRATRLARYFSALDKEYRVMMKLGEATDTQDAEGRIIERADCSSLNESDIREAIASFRGRIKQMPPMFSALKHRGTPLYKLARQGVEVERREREVDIYELDVLAVNIPFVTFRARCSGGTYMRTLCDDIGRKLGTYGHLYALERSGVGGFRVEESLPVRELRRFRTNLPDAIREHQAFFSMKDALSWLPEIRISGMMERHVRHGAPLGTGELPRLDDEITAAEGVRIVTRNGELLAVGRFHSQKKEIRMEVVFG
jgi:tRNA pseudouridine55 synthase